MSQFKSKEEYEKWKIEKQKQSQQNKVGIPSKETEQSEPLTTTRPSIETKSSKKKAILFVAIGLIVLSSATFFLWSYMTHGKVSGNIYAVMKSGDVKKAAGITVYLLKVDSPETVSDELRRLYEDHSNSTLNIIKNRSDYLAELRRLDTTYQATLDKLLLSKRVQETQTDVNGFYDFLKIPYGKYMILTTYKVFENNLEWLHPVEINKKETKVDLTNSNTTPFPIYTFRTYTE